MEMGGRASNVRLCFDSLWDWEALSSCNNSLNDEISPYLKAEQTLSGLGLGALSLKYCVWTRPFIVWSSLVCGCQLNCDLWKGAGNYFFFTNYTFLFLPLVRSLTESVIPMSCFLNIFGCRWCGVSQFHDQVDGQNSLLLIHLLCINYISNYDVPRLDPLTRLINQVMTLKKSTVPETCEVFFFFFFGTLMRQNY